MTPPEPPHADASAAMVTSAEPAADAPATWTEAPLAGAAPK